MRHHSFHDLYQITPVPACSLPLNVGHPPEQFSLIDHRTIPPGSGVGYFSPIFYDFWKYTVKNCALILVVTYLSLHGRLQICYGLHPNQFSGRPHTKFTCLPLILGPSFKRIRCIATKIKPLPLILGFHDTNRAIPRILGFH